MEQVENADAEPCANIEQSRHEYRRNMGQQHFGAGNIQCIKCGRRYSITNRNDILVHDLNVEFCMNIKSTVAIFFTEGHDADCSNRKRGDFSDSARTPDAVKPEENGERKHGDDFEHECPQERYESRN